MAVKRQRHTFSMISMASMTDVIFPTLTFFMVTSTFVSPSALEVNLPQSSQTTTLKPTTRIYVDSAMNMYCTQGDSLQEGELMPLPPAQLDGFLANLHQNNPQEFVALYADEEVPYGKIVEILDKGSRNGLKIVLATKPASAKYAAPEPDEQSATQQQAVTAQPAQ